MSLRPVKRSLLSEYSCRPVLENLRIYGRNRAAVDGRDCCVQGSHRLRVPVAEEPYGYASCDGSGRGPEARQQCRAPMGQSYPAKEDVRHDEEQHSFRNPR